MPSTHFSANAVAVAASSAIEPSRLRAISGMRTFSSNWPCIPPTVIAVSLPMTWALTCSTTSGITGLTLPGMIEEPFCSSGRNSSPMPARGPEPMSAMSWAILVSETATTFSAPDSSTSASRLAWASNGSAGGAMPEPGLAHEQLAHALGELRVGVEPGARRGAAERDLPDVHERGIDALTSQAHLRGVAGELLAERDRHGVHRCVRPALTWRSRRLAWRAKERSRRSSAGSSVFVASSSAARCTALGKTS